MGKTINANWDIAKAMCLKGLSLPEIAKQTGLSYEALRQRAHRGKWLQSATLASEKVTQAVTTSMTDFATKHVNLILGFADNAFANLSKRGFDLPINDLQTLVNVADKLDNMKRRTLRMDEQQTRASTLVSVVVNGQNVARERDFIELNGESVKLLDDSAS